MDEDHRVYLDHAATTPLRPEVAAAIAEVLASPLGNPSSLHGSGRLARRLLEEARDRVAAVMGARAKQVVFTSGATEADNLGVRGLVAARGGALVTSPLEHAAVRSSAALLAAAGVRVAYVVSGAGGHVAPGAVAAALAAAGDGAVVALMLVNNETGVMLDAPAVAEVCHEAGALFFCDVVQGQGVEDVSMRATGADAAAVSAHKVGGPPGIGALVLAEGAEPEPLTAGGEQERGLRPGTQAVAAAVGMSVALELAEADREALRTRMARLRDELERGLLAVGGVVVNGSEAPRSVKHANVTIAGVDGESLLIALDDAGVEVSAGSACAAGSLEPSRVLLALGRSPDEARASLRFSLGRDTTEREVALATARFAEVVERCRAVAA